MSVRILNTNVDVDVAIVGGSTVGATLAGILGRYGMRVAVLERAPPMSAFTQAGSYDLRVFAITRAAERIFRGIGAWRHIEAQRLGYMRKMRVWDANGNGIIHFDSAEIAEPTLGYIIESRVIQCALEEALKELPNVTWYRPASLQSIEQQAEQVVLQLEDDRRLSTKLVVGADGGRSRVRDLAGIEAEYRAYQQTALVAMVRSEKPHQDTAWQRFLSTGPLAFLPLDQPELCSIVWSATTEHADSLSTLTDDNFRDALAEAFAGTLGDIISIGPRQAFPLLRGHAEQYVQPRLALIGDAIHQIHPLAGQGANLGILDAACLGEVLIEARQANRDHGKLSVLRRYERWRKGENLAMLTAMDGFKHLFGNQLPPLPWLRNTGLNITNALPPVKRLIMRRAMGLAGDLPRLGRG